MAVIVRFEVFKINVAGAERVGVFRELLRRNPGLPAERIDDVAVAATTQMGDQGMTIGRSAGLLAGLPQSVPGYSVDRMCAGAMTAVTTLSAGIMAGAYDVVLAGGVGQASRRFGNRREFSLRTVSKSCAAACNLSAHD